MDEGISESTRRKSERALKMRAAGMQTEQIAAELGCSVPWAYELMNRVAKQIAGEDRAISNAKKHRANMAKRRDRSRAWWSYPDEDLLDEARAGRAEIERAGAWRS